MANVGSLVIRGAKTLTFATVVMALYYLFYYSGGFFLFSSNTVEGLNQGS